MHTSQAYFRETLQSSLKACALCVRASPFCERSWTDITHWQHCHARRVSHIYPMASHMGIWRVRVRVSGRPKPDAQAAPG